MEDAPCIVTKSSATDAKTLKRVASFWRSLGSRVAITNPAGHDKSVSLISHLPHIVAFSLAGAVPEKEMLYAAEGFKDTTRVASSDPKLWADIFLTNAKEIVRAGRQFERYYKNLMKTISKGDYAKTVAILKSAKSKRDKFVYGQK